MVAQIGTGFARTRPMRAWARILAYALFEGRPLTTRGRWINPLVLGGHHLWRALPQFASVRAPIYILGVGRSGTTVLGTILAMHRDVGYLNEPKALWHCALQDDDLIGSYSPRPGRYRLDAGAAHPRARRQIAHSYGAFLRLTGSRRIADKYPELLFRTSLVQELFPDARLIVLVRNGLDTCQSIENWSARNGHTDLSGRSDWWGKNRRKWKALVEQVVAPDPYFAAALPAIRLLTRHVDMAAVEWIASMREARALMAQGRTNIHLLRYEDLAQHPRQTLGKLLAFCGLPHDETMLRFGENTLRPRAPYQAPRLHRAIRPLFNETMEMLGYRARQPHAHPAN